MNRVQSYCPTLTLSKGESFLSYFCDDLYNHLSSFLTEIEKENAQIACLQKENNYRITRSFVRAVNFSISERVQQISSKFIKISEELRNSSAPVLFPLQSNLKGRLHIRNTFGVCSIQEDHYPYSALIKYYLSHGKLEEAVKEIKEMPKEVRDNVFAELVYVLASQNNGGDLPYKRIFQNIEDPRVRMHIAYNVSDKSLEVAMSNNSSEYYGFLIKDIWKKENWEEARNGLENLQEEQEYFFTEILAFFVITAIREEKNKADEVIEKVLEFIDDNSSIDFFEFIKKLVINNGNLLEYHYVLKVISKLDPIQKKEAYYCLVKFLFIKESIRALPDFFDAMEPIERKELISSIFSEHAQNPTGNSRFYPRMIQRILFYVADKFSAEECVYFLSLFSGQVREQVRDEYVERFFIHLLSQNKWKVTLNLILVSSEFSSIWISILAKALKKEEFVPDDFDDFWKENYSTKDNPLEIEGLDADPLKMIVHSTQYLNKTKRDQILEKLSI